MALIRGLAIAWPFACYAQQPQGLAISVASPLQAEPASRVRLPIQLGPLEELRKNSFLRIRGLPPAAALSEGHAISPGTWAVPLIALPTLSIILPGGAQGQSDVVISLVNVDGGILAEARMLLVVAPTLKEPGVMLLPQAERERALALHEKCESMPAGPVVSADDQRRAQRASANHDALAMPAMDAVFTKCPPSP